jgi:ketosteroid isomerase-like protein
MMSGTSNAAEEIREQERAYLESMQALNLEAFLAHYHDDLLGWPSDQAEPVDKTAMRQSEVVEMAAIEPGSVAIEMKSMGVRVFGDVGIIYCKVHFSAVMMDGAPITVHSRYIHTWLRTEAGWKIIGGMSAPLTTPG